MEDAAAAGLVCAAGGCSVEHEEQAEGSFIVGGWGEVGAQQVVWWWVNLAKSH